MDKPARQNKTVVLAALWVLHIAAICAMLLLGRTLGLWLVDQWSQPIRATEISEEWWEIFRRFASTVMVSLFIAISLAYTVLIRPGRG